MALIFVGMLTVMMYATGVYQQGVRPYVAPVLARVKQTWEERQTKQAAPQVDLPRPVAAQVHTQQPGLAEPAGLQQNGRVPEGPPSSTPPENETKHLVRVYERMRAKDAASIVEQLEVPLAVEILSQMTDRQAARILGAMAPERAARITARLAERSQ
jgi:flagellar motility protein MotE (MotC chaperone)